MTGLLSFRARDNMLSASEVFGVGPQVEEFASKIR